jgi:hypothetical protein
MFGSPIRIERIPYIRNFAEAKQVYERIKPVRGRSDGKRPLVDRSAVDSYHILKNEDGSYSCVLYQTKVLTFYADDTVKIDTGMWESQTTRAFIQNILGLGCFRKNQHEVLLLDTNRRVEPFCILGKEPTVVRQGRNSEVWELVKSPVTTEVKLLRREANTVKKRYKEFADYLKSNLKLRANEHGRVQIANDEFINAFPKGSYMRNLHWSRMEAKGYSGYEEMNEIFFGLAGATDDDKHEKFYQASLLLVANARGIMLSHLGDETSNRSWTINNYGKALLNKFNELVLKWHSDEVFEVTPARVGVVPVPKYKDYVSKEGLNT